MTCRLSSIAEFDIPRIQERLEVDPQSSLVESLSTSINCESATKPCIFSSLISLSPFGEAAVVANRTSAVVLTAKWNYSNTDEDQPQETYKVSLNLDLNSDERGDVTAVLCLPLIFSGREGGSRKKEDITVDWTCVAVGFSSGYIHFYDEAGNLLFFKQPYNEPILSLKCQSFQPAALYQDEYAEEIYVLYKSVLICIPGSVIFQVLRDRRSDLAKVTANVLETPCSTPISYKIWKFTQQDSIADCEVVGPSSAGLFDHLRCASLLGGFHAKYQTAPPKTTRLVACGRNEFVGFHYFFESASGFTDWKAVTSALANSVVGFFSSQKKSDKAKKDVIETDELVNRWFFISDSNREGRSIIRSPNREYLAVTDNLGRICIIDNTRETVARVLKGYRGAQCGWLAVEDEGRQESSSRSRSTNRTVVYLLVIYSPRTGRLEIRPVPYGVAVAELDAGRNGRLIYTPHRLVGLKNRAVNWNAHKWRTCMYLNSEGKLFDLCVPFYCVLGEGEDRLYARDSFLLRKLRHFLRDTDGTDEEIAQEVGLTASELKSTSGMLDCVQLLSTSRNTCPEAIEAAVAVFIDKMSLKQDKHSDLLPSEKCLLRKSLLLRNLTGLYKYVRKQEDKPPDYFSVVEGSSMEPDILSTQLFTSHREVSNLRMRLAMKSKRSTDAVKQEPVVKFKEKPAKSTFTKYISCFDIVTDSKIEDYENERVGLSPNLPFEQEKFSFLSDLLFRNVLNGSDISEFREEILCCGVDPMFLTLLAVRFWLDSDLSDVPDKDMVRFAQVIGVICHMEAESKIAADYNEISPWWDVVRERLKDSISPLNALAAAFVCRSVAIRIECQIDAQYIKSAKLADETWSDSDNSSDSESSKKGKEKGSANEWEAMSADRTQWNLLIGLLEDVTILDCILSRNPRGEITNMIGTPLPVLPYEKPVISLGQILKGGTGSISELVARWLASSGIVAKSVVDSTDVEWQSIKERSEKRKKKGKCDIPATFFDGMQAEDAVLEGKEPFATQCLRILKWHFPFSLTGTTLLAELSYVYFKLWDTIFSKNDPSESQNIFEGALSCLSHIPSPHVKKGLCYLIWTEFIWIRVKNFADFVNLPWIPRVRRPRFDSRSEYTDWLIFSSQCLSFVRLYTEISEICSLGPDVESNSAFYQHEDLWDSNMANENIGSSLVTRLLAVRNSYVPLSLILQITSVMQIMVELNIHVTGFMKELFGSSGLFNKAITSTPNPNPAVFEVKNSELLVGRRYVFLCDVVEASLKTVSSLPVNSDWSPAMKECMETALRWMSRCEELVLLWNLDYDELRRFQVCLLYRAGLDSIADEIRPAVREKEKLALSLAIIAGQRLRLFLDNSNELTEYMSTIEPTLSKWLDSLDTKDIRQVDLDRIFHLAKFVGGISPSSRATMMLEAIVALNRDRES